MKSALVTGASRGIGRGIALSLAAKGFGLTVTARTEPALEELASELESAGAIKVLTLPAEMADTEALPELVKLHGASFGSMAALILNAGVGTAGPVATYPLHRLEKTLTVNLTAPFVLLRESLPLLRAWAEQDAVGAKVVALSSITGVFSEPGLAAYGASKAALLSLVETVNQEESGNGVTATAIAPAFVETDMSAWTADTVPPDSMIPVRDVVAVVDLALALGRTTAIPRIVLTRSGTDGHRA